MPTTAPFLMFEGSAEAAFTFYAATIPDSRIIEMQKYGPDGPGPEGSVMVGRASIGGLEVMFSDSFVHHDFGFTLSISLFVTCASEAEFDQVLSTLADGAAC
jgi:predicted 3-demethylubiquinone-9 3-methyltransferase (glyoxalase superfamily)